MDSIGAEASSEAAKVSCRLAARLIRLVSTSLEAPHPRHLLYLGRR